ncbi:helix-hairpin-helix domain-containing protein [uncultured Proteiniphilum sp.]|uniref:helix-hairpin-helix domain-containing protein n=1 Tax=uncultured Proteiniphilum sp. TaxID=497637 RepID=UPI00260CE825|nr:helix-hairpin-helix domain-containing protein [uncultured Proteiniphilum sp.]
MRWKDFLYFQRGSKTAVILLLILIVLTLILNAFLSYRNSSDVILMQNDSLVREFEEFKRTLKVREVPSTVVDEGMSGARKSSRSAIPEEGESTVEQLPGRSGSTHESPSRQNERYVSRGDRSSLRAAYPAIEKLSEGETISLNETDTATWKKVPGIGSVYASRIVKYRELLGGFIHVEQLLEVYGIDQELFSRIVVYIEPDGNYRRMQVNQSDFRELLRHPYLNYKQVQAIMSIRRRKGDITSIRELSLLDEFTPEDILRLEPYLEF